MLQLSDFVSTIPAVLSKVYGEYEDDKKISVGEIFEILAFILEHMKEHFEDKYLPIVEAVTSLLLKMATFFGESLGD